MSRRLRWFRLILLPALRSTEAGVSTRASAAPNPRPVASWRERATEAGKYIVVLKPASGGVSASRVTASVASDPGVQITQTYSHALNGFAANLSAGAVNALKGDARVEMIIPDLKVYPFAQEIPAGAKRAGAATNPIAKIDGVDQRVNASIAILDMGIGPNNDLNIVGGVDCTASSDPVYPTYSDVGGHGTHVAEIAAAIDNASGIVGVAPGARIWPVRVLGSVDGSWSWVLCGIDWVTAHASTVDVANMSLGEDLGNAYPDLDNPIHNAVKKSVAASVTFVAAASNAGTTALKTVPAKYAEVIAVSAFCDSDGKPGGWGPPLSACADDAFASFSNFGSVADISAPGVDTRLLASGGGNSVMSGASFASPQVAGAALMAAKETGAIPGDTDGWNEGRLDVGSLVAGTVAMGHDSGPVGATA